MKKLFQCIIFLSLASFGFATEKSDDLNTYGIYLKTAKRPPKAESPIKTKLPLKLSKNSRIALIGNTLFDRARYFAHFESYVQQAFPDHQLVIRNLAWSADEIDLQPRPDNFADLEQHLYYEKVDVIFAAFGFNESFAGKKGLLSFKNKLIKYIQQLKNKAFNGHSAAQVIFVSPTANENIHNVRAADLNQKNIAMYAAVMKKVCEEQHVAYVDVFSDTLQAMQDPKTDLTINGVHLNEYGYQFFSKSLFEKTFAKSAPKLNEKMRELLQDKNLQYFRRYRPLNTFYYTGKRKEPYGYLDFHPAMRNFQKMVENREKKSWELSKTPEATTQVDDSNIPPMESPSVKRGGNKWLSPADELKNFIVDPRFEVNCFASEEDFPELACPIQIRWDSLGRLWVSCSTTYPHVYPGQEPNDKIIILEDTNGDGKADKSSVFADKLEIPLSFEFADGGIYVSEQPHLTFLKDTNGDGKADVRKMVLTGFGCEDSHHSLHDFVWTPEGELLIRESIFHHSQVETVYGPIRAKNSAWFSFRPRDQRLSVFGSYPNTNPWGVTFDDWGNHVASHPNFASAFHAKNPAYPNQHPRANNLKGYSGTCGQEFIDFKSWPKEMQGNFVKVRYKPTNRVELHEWIEKDDHYREKFVTNLIFSKNLSFIPVDVRFGPRGALYVCDWYNPIKGHAQYSLRDERRDRKSGRIWRITPKNSKLQDPPKFVNQSVESLLNILKRKEYRYRYWAKREIRRHKQDDVEKALISWLKSLDKTDPRYRHHQVEAMWLYQNINRFNRSLFLELLQCENHHARVAATKQLREYYPLLKNRNELLTRQARDDNARVRMEAVIAASYINRKEALDAILPVFDKPMGDHLAYAAYTSLNSEGINSILNEPNYSNRKKITDLRNNIFNRISKKGGRKKLSARESDFDSQKNIAEFKIKALKERMLFDVTKIEVQAGQPVKITFFNPDATAHNLVIVKPGSIQEVGIKANEMAKDPKASKKHFVPKSNKVLHATKLLKMGESQTLRFKAPKEPGVYPYICTFPGHWFIMKGEMIVSKANKGS